MQGTLGYEEVEQADEMARLAEIDKMKADGLLVFVCEIARVLFLGVTDRGWSARLYSLPDK